MTRGISGFQPKRLLQALAVRRLSQVNLAAMVGVSTSTISKWKSGAQAPEHDALERLATVINVSSEWFTRLPIEKTSEPLFRSNASTHKAAREMLEARLEWAQELSIQLEQFVEFPILNLPDRRFLSPDDISDQDIEMAAQSCRDLWRLGSGPIPDVALALENAGVILVREETGTAQIEGLSAWSDLLGRPFVLLSSDKGNGFRSRFDAAHELAHLVLHRSIPRAAERLRYNEMERQAHRFAGAFLLPAESLLAEVRLPTTLDSLLLVKQRWGVSVAAIIMRLEAIGAISEADKLSLFKRRSVRWGAKAEPGDAKRSVERPRLLKRTIELLISSNIMPASEISRYVGLGNRDIESLAGLPERFLDETATVVDLATLRKNGDPAPTAVSEQRVSNVISFDRRK